jgi:hypothetical protein
MVFIYDIIHAVSVNAATEITLNKSAAKSNGDFDG